LRREVLAGILEPLQNLQAVAICEGAKNGVPIHMFSIQNGSCTFS